MDLGFGGFLEKFEDHLGRGWTKALVILIGLTVATICGSLLWQYLLLPIAELIPDPHSGPAAQFAKLVFVAALFLMITNQLWDLVDNFLRKRLRARLREGVERSERLVKELKEARSEVSDLHAKYGDRIAVAELAVERAINVSLERGLLTPQEAAELRAMVEERPNPSAPA